MPTTPPVAQNPSMLAGLFPGLSLELVASQKKYFQKNPGSIDRLTEKMTVHTKAGKTPNEAFALALSVNKNVVNAAVKLRLQDIDQHRFENDGVATRTFHYFDITSKAGIPAQEAFNEIKGFNIFQLDLALMGLNKEQVLTFSRYPASSEKVIHEYFSFATSQGISPPTAFRCFELVVTSVTPVHQVDPLSPLQIEDTLIPTLRGFLIQQRLFIERGYDPELAYTKDAGINAPFFKEPESTLTAPCRIVRSLSADALKLQ